MQKTKSKSADAVTGADRITAWSFSRWRDYEDCPKRAYYRHVLRLPEPGGAGPALVRGSQIHELAELYLKAEIPTAKLALPRELSKFEHEFKELRKVKAIPEQQWAFDVEWNSVDWFAPNVWLRVKVDAVALLRTSARVVDFKTGRISGAHATQLELYAMAALTQTEAKTIQTQLWYLDSGDLHALDFRRKELDGLRETWIKRTEKMLGDSVFKATPSESACRWCPFSQKKGGPCVEGI